MLTLATISIISIVAFAVLVLLQIALDFPPASEVSSIIRVPLLVLALPTFVALTLGLFALAWIISTVWPDEPRPTFADLKEVLEDYLAALRGDD